MKTISNFKKNKYKIIKNAVSQELTEFVYKYFLFKREIATTLIKTKYISQFNTLFGVWNDSQIPNTY